VDFTLKYSKNTNQKFKECLGTTGGFNKIMIPNTPSILHGIFFPEVIACPSNSPDQLKTYDLLLNAMRKNVSLKILESWSNF